MHARLGLAPAGAALAPLLRTWSGKGRFYHSADHLLHGLRVLERQGPALDLVRLAWMFHDLVYVPGRADNEAVSAERFERHAAAHGLAAEPTRRGVQLILLTRDHQGAVTDDPLWPALNDTDLSVFAGSPADYERYAERVWREYAAVYTRRQFVLGRAAFMQAFVQRPIFLTPAFKTKETAARANIAAEVARLQAEARREGWAAS